MVIGTSCRDFVMKGHGYRLRSVRVNMIDRGIRSYFFHDHFKEKCFYTRFSIVLQAQVYSSKLPEYSGKRFIHVYTHEFVIALPAIFHTTPSNDLKLLYHHVINVLDIHISYSTYKILRKVWFLMCTWI